ncbi:methyl farnesoate epoxidase-like [Periplaneta americana]|uniref:methyl farnesoate epoxidase-like n=1 Tax=Periplaneta americana TaxID=6978 RepID=UPI0037E94A8B
MLTLLLFVAVILLILWKMTSKPKKFPPGPPKWPLVGNAFQLKSPNLLLHEVLGAFAEKYGEVTGLYTASQPLILVSGPDAIREALNKPELQGRPTSATQKFEKRNLGIAFIEDDVWKDHRRFSLRHLRELGMGKREMEAIIHDEIRDLMDEVKRYAGPEYSKPVPVRELVAATGANVIYHMLSGERFSLRDPKLRHLMEIIRKLIALTDASGGFASSMLILLRVLPSLTKYPELKKFRNELFSFLTEKIEEHKKKLDEDNPSDFIDMFLVEMNKNDSHPSFHMDQLLQLIYELFIAGSDTTSGSLSFAFLYMVLYPEVQVKVQKELDDVIGRERLPSLNDRAKLRYVEATLNEIFRMASVAPLAVPHSIINENSDVEFRGYVIPKNSRIVVNLHGLHKDKKYWGDPEKFRPERFLDSEGNLRKEDALIPFGTGKRSCVGESLARNNIFLTFTSFMQNFSMKTPDGDPTPSAEPEGGLILCARPFRVNMTQRPL